MAVNYYKTKLMKKYNEGREEFNPSYDEHHIKLFMNLLIVGKPGSGKTNQVLDIIHKMRGCFAKILIYTANVTEPLYVMLQDLLNVEGKNVVILEEIKRIPRLADLETGKMQQLVIIDDFITQDKKILTKIEEYSIRGRQRLLTCCFLSQSYYACPIKIRCTIRYLCLLRITDKKNLSMIISTIASSIPDDILTKCIKNATLFELNVAVIDLQAKSSNTILRRNFGTDNYYILEDENEEPIANPVLFMEDGIKN